MPLRGCSLWLAVHHLPRYTYELWPMQSAGTTLFQKRSWLKTLYHRLIPHLLLNCLLESNLIFGFGKWLVCSTYDPCMLCSRFILIIPHYQHAILTKCCVLQHLQLACSLTREEGEGEKKKRKAFPKVTTTASLILWSRRRPPHEGYTAQHGVESWAQRHRIR